MKQTALTVKKIMSRSAVSGEILSISLRVDLLPLAQLTHKMQATFHTESGGLPR